MDIIKQLEKDYSIDPDQICATGKLDGSRFGGTVACDPVLSQKIAAFGPVSGAFYVEESRTLYPAGVTIPCNPGQAKIPIMKFPGYKDRTIEYSQGTRNSACLPTIPHWTQGWALRDG